MNTDFQTMTNYEATPSTPFRSKGQALRFELCDFWEWAYHDLLTNTVRGVLAEFIVKMALGDNSDSRIAWDAYDLESEGLKVEVKSASYLQSWQQEKLSEIKFDIAPKEHAANKGEKSYVVKRHADVYVFCLLNHKELKTVNPLNMDQWTFYVVPSSVLDEKVGAQKSIVLRPLKDLGAVECSFDELRKEFSKMRG